MWQIYNADGVVRAVTLVVHGLNVRPTAMMAYVQLLSKSGSDVLLVSLWGHYESDVESNSLDATAWRVDMEEGFGAAQKRAAELGVPLYLLGYSLGALLAQSMIGLSFPGKSFEKQVLIAPAIALRWHCYLIKGLFFCGADKKVPSYTPKRYRVHRSLPLGMYQVLFREQKKLERATFKSLDIPTMIIMDPKDELVSYRKLNYLRQYYNFKQCEFVALNSSLKERKTFYHHCVLDADSMGIENWQLASEKIKVFLFDNSAFNNEKL